MYNGPMSPLDLRKDTATTNYYKTNKAIVKELAAKGVEVGGATFLGGFHPQRSGNMSGNVGYIGSTRNALEPTLYINYPNATTPTYGITINNVRRNPKYGYPCNIISNDSLVGTEEYYFAQFKNVKLTFTAYKEIEDEIIELLETGVYL